MLNLWFVNPSEYAATLDAHRPYKSPKIRPVYGVSRRFPIMGDSLELQSGCFGSRRFDGDMYVIDGPPASVHGKTERYQFKSALTMDRRREVASSVTNFLRLIGSEPDSGAINDALTVSSNAGYETRVRLAIQPIRKAEIIDPLDFDSRQFQDALLHVSTSGSTPLFSLRAKKAIKVTASNLVFDQPGESGRDAEGWYGKAVLSTHGFLLAERAVGSPSRQNWGDAGSWGLALQLSDLTESIASLFQFASSMYNQLDPYIAFRDLIYNVALVNLGHRYIYDVAPSPGRGIPVRMGDNANILAFDSARGIVREGLDVADEEVRRVIALLRRKAQPDL